MSEYSSSPLPVDPGPRRLGRTELSVGPIAYGCWRMAEVDAGRARENLEAALDLGMTLVDTADVYGLDSDAPFGEAERRLGAVLAEAPGLRERIVLATKGGIVPGVPYDSSASHLRAACEASLERLGVDTIDLYQLHRPDILTHPAEVAAALTALRTEGKIREVGLSNVTVAQFDTLQRFLDFPIATHQPEFSLLALGPVEDGLFDQCLREQVTPLAWSPLGGGRLALGADELAGDERLRRVADLLDVLAGRCGVSRSAVALAFVLAHPVGAIPIVGTQRAERLREVARATEVTLTRRDWYDLYAASRGAPLP